jgi:hypothetical protein
MGVVEVDPAELARYRAKQKQTHNRYIQKRQAMMKKGSREKHAAQARDAHLDWRRRLGRGDAKNLPFV